MSLKNVEIVRRAFSSSAPLSSIGSVAPDADAEALSAVGLEK